MIDDTAAPTGLFTEDGHITRCVWCRATPAYQHYHDQEWGFPVHDDRRLFEKICLEGFQAGLSWLTILKKRESFRRGFAEFDMIRLPGLVKPRPKGCCWMSALFDIRARLPRPSTMHSARWN
jgi:DNA-3-methyladenine glycosylase I